MNIDFKTIKSKVLDTINNNTYKEVTRHTKYNCTGIYMIYINNFNSDKIIPIYIGKSENIQKRYKQHLSEILILNRFNKTYLKKLIFDDFYNGHYKSLKIFKYMVDNNCNLNDFHMIILEETTSQNLSQLEEEYFRVYYPSFVGFNQINSRLEIINIFFNKDKTEKEILLSNYLKTLQEDINFFYKFIDYGYSRFNFNIAFLNVIPIFDFEDNLKSKNIQNIIKEINKKSSKIHDDLLTNKDKILITENKRLNSKETNTKKLYRKKRQELKELEKVLFNNANIKSKIERENFLDSLYNDNKESEEKFKKYLAKRQINNFYEDNYKTIQTILKKYKEVSALYVKCDDIENTIKENKFYYLSMLLPTKKYISFPLQDCFEEYHFLDKIDENTCYINFDITNNGLYNYNSIVFKDPQIMKIDYKININEKIYERKNIFIKQNEICTFDNENLLYIEKEHVFKNPYSLYRNCFSLYLYNTSSNGLCESYITDIAEYKTGINDYTLNCYQKFNLIEILIEINSLINENTKLVINCSESLSCLKSAITLPIKKKRDLYLVQKILNMKK